MIKQKKYLGILPVFCIIGACSLFAGVALSADPYVYESHGKRDPFVPLIGVDKPVVTRLEEITSIDDVKLEGIALGAKGERNAILNGEIVKEGRRVGEIVIQKIDKKSVSLLMGGKEYSVNLAEEEGDK